MEANIVYTVETAPVQQLIAIEEQQELDLGVRVPPNKGETHARTPCQGWYMMHSIGQNKAYGIPRGAHVSPARGLPRE
jgi:hypothetical protein